MRPAPRTAIILIFGLLTAPASFGIPYSWEAKNGESPFELDVPEAWRIRESVKRNGVIAQFRHGDARIEVRSFTEKDNVEFAQVVNQKAARLASEYSFVRLIDERDSKFRENLHFSVWEFKRQGRLYRDETGIVLSSAGPVVISCVVPAAKYELLRTHCENAFYSITLDGKAESTTNNDGHKTDLVAELSRIYYLNVPGSLPVLSPEALIGVQPTQAPAAIKTEYDENYILPNENNK